MGASHFVRLVLSRLVLRLVVLLPHFVLSPFLSLISVHRRCHSYLAPVASVVVFVLVIRLSPSLRLMPPRRCQLRSPRYPI